jgi:hypothetical protein
MHHRHHVESTVVKDDDPYLTVGSAVVNGDDPHLTFCFCNANTMQLAVADLEEEVRSGNLAVLQT